MKNPRKTNLRIEAMTLFARGCVCVWLLLVLWFLLLCCAVLCCVVLCCVVLCRVVLYCFALCRVVYVGALAR